MENKEQIFLALGLIKATQENHTEFLNSLDQKLGAIHLQAKASRLEMQAYFEESAAREEKANLRLLKNICDHMNRKVKSVESFQWELVKLLKKQVEGEEDGNIPSYF